MDCYGDVLHFINANYLNYAIMPEYARVGQSMHVVQLIPGFLFKSFNGAPSAAKNRSRSGRKVPACRNPTMGGNATFRLICSKLAEKLRDKRDFRPILPLKWPQKGRHWRKANALQEST